MRMYGKKNKNIQKPLAKARGFLYNANVVT